jgi:hypothetical protein
MTDEALCGSILRSYLLMVDPRQQDAADAMFAKAGTKLVGISDDLTRELYGFVNGMLAALAMSGVEDASAALGRICSFDARDNPTAMRRALAAVWESIAA